MSLKRRLVKLEPLIRERWIKQTAAELYQVEVADGLLSLYMALAPEEYERAKTVFLEHAQEVLQDAYGASWREHFWLEGLG